MTEPTHNPSDESHAGELLAGKPPEQFLWGGAGNESSSRSVPRQSLTRQTFHTILKSGWRAERSTLRTAARLVNLLATFCILIWRIFWMTMLNSCLTQRARLGGHLNRAGPAPAGNTDIRRGLSRLTAIEIGYLLGSQNVGN
ncbi:MAG: hypothetical protein WB781_26330 [Candidatus Sulfotelmatobacter sp.]